MCISENTHTLPEDSSVLHPVLHPVLLASVIEVGVVNRQGS